MKKSSWYCARVEGAMIRRVGISGRQTDVSGKLELVRGSKWSSSVVSRVSWGFTLASEPVSEDTGLLEGLGRPLIPPSPTQVHCASGLCFRSSSLLHLKSHLFILSVTAQLLAFPALHPFSLQPWMGLFSLYCANIESNLEGSITLVIVEGSWISFPQENILFHNFHLHF